MSNIVRLDDRRPKPDKHYVNNCLVINKDGDPAFRFSDDGSWRITMDGYAIVPKEEYLEMCRAMKLKLVEDNGSIRSRIYKWLGI